MEHSTPNTSATGLTNGDVDALGPLALLRQSFMNGSMNPNQLSSTVDKMASELKVYKDMADYYQMQATKLNQGLPPLGLVPTAAPAPSKPAPIPASVSLRSVVLNPPDFKAALHTHGDGDAKLGFQGIRFQNGGKELVLEDGRVLSTREVMNRICKAYLESLAVLACKDCAIPLPESEMVEKFVLLCQPLSFHDQRAPEDCTEPIAETITNILTSEDAPLEVLIDLWEHTVVFCAGAVAMGGRVNDSTPSTPGSSSTTPSSAATSPLGQTGASNSHSGSASGTTVSSSNFNNSVITPTTPLSKAIADSGTTYQSIFGNFGFGPVPGAKILDSTSGLVPSTPSGISTSLGSSSVLNSFVTIFSTNCEKLMRVIIFRRESHTQERYAERLVRCLNGTSVHYRNVNKLGAASSLLMIAHQIIAMFPSVIPPVTSDRIYVLLLLGASTEHERNEWLHMLHDQIHFTTSILLSFNVGFIVSKLRTNPLITKPVWEEISTRLTELESLLPTLKPDVPLFQVWVKILIACFHGELGARCGDMDRAALALSRIEQLVMDNYSSSLAVILLAELRNFAQHCSPCSVVLNGKEQVLCHYVISRVEAIHEDMMSNHADGVDELSSSSKNDDRSRNSGSGSHTIVQPPTVATLSSQNRFSGPPTHYGSQSNDLPSSNSMDSDETTVGDKSQSKKSSNFVPNNAPVHRSRPVPHFYPSPMPPRSQSNSKSIDTQTSSNSFGSFHNTPPESLDLHQTLSELPSHPLNASRQGQQQAPNTNTGRIPPVTTNPLVASSTIGIPPFAPGQSDYEAVAESGYQYPGDMFAEPSSSSASSGQAPFDTGDWEYPQLSSDPDILLSNWSASHNRLNAELFGFSDPATSDDPDTPSN